MSLADDYRERAKAQRELANKLVLEPDVLKNATKFVASIVGQVNATVLEGLADTMDYLKASSAQDKVLGQRQILMQRMNAARLAAARGDWDEFDRLASGSADAPGKAAGTSSQGD